MPDGRTVEEAQVKGDRIDVHIATGGGATYSDTVTASKAGRRVQTKVHRQWTIVEEVTRNGRPTGTSLKVLTTALLLLVEKRGEAPNQPAKASRRLSPGVSTAAAVAGIGGVYVPGRTPPPPVDRD
jgi:hypothetical protein